MNKNDFKVFQLHGLSGLLFFGIVISGLFCGFVLFPIWMIMTGWNSMLATAYNLPVINHYQASLLWVFIVLCCYLVMKNSISIKIHKSEYDDEETINRIIEEERNES